MIWESDKAVQVLPSGCIVWTAADKGNGYGMVWQDGKVQMTHRVAYEQKYGAIPAGHLVCHRCDVRSCINPDHLFLGTHADNSADMWAKGRGLFGDRAHWAKVSEADVQAIKAAYEAGRPQREIGAEYGLSQQQVSRICRGERWGRASIGAEQGQSPA